MTIKQQSFLFFSQKKKLAASITRGRRERTIRIATIRILICRFIQINSIRALGYVHAPVALLRNHVYRIIIFRGIYLLAMLIMFRCASVCKLMGNEHSLITKQRRARSIWNAFFFLLPLLLSQWIFMFVALGSFITMLIMGSLRESCLAQD